MKLRQENKKETIEQMSNEALIEKCDKWILDLCRSGGKDWTLEIPANFERDPDMLFSELIKRFKEKSGQSLVEEVDVPPGIIAFVNNSDTIVIQKGMDYKTWVRYHLNDLCSPASVIHSISVEGVVWTCGDKTNKGELLELFYDKNLGWSAMVGDNNAFSFKNNKVYKLRNPPTERKIDGDFTKADTKLTGTENFKPEERKIIRYKLIKKYPGSSEIGTQHFPDGTDYHDDTEFWQPIYEEPNKPVCELPDEKLMVEFAKWIITTLTGKEMDWESIVKKFYETKTPTP